jgi:glycerate kinase
MALRNETSERLGGPMRVLIASDSIGGWSSAQAGQALAAAWDSADVRVLPVGSAGQGFVQAMADRLRTTVDTSVAGDVLASSAHAGDEAVVGVEAPGRGPGIAYDATSRPLGEAIERLLQSTRPARLYVDLAGLAVHDGGAGLLGALGATADVPLDAGVAGLTGLSQLDLSAATARLADIDLVGVAPTNQLSQPLFGLRGITSLARDVDAVPELMLSTDATLEQMAALTGVVPANQPGSGACGGLGLAVLALGGRLATGPAVSLASVELRGLDLLVTGCSIFDFVTRGGGVVAAMAEAAATALSPCIVVAGEVLIGSREMRTMGIEAAYAVRETVSDAPTDAAVSLAELGARARRVARSWSW